MLRLLIAAAATSALVAQSVTTPNANANSPGTSGLNTIVRNAGNPRTYMYGVNASELANVPVGAAITGVSLRLYPSTTVPSWPVSDITWTDYEISVGPAAPLASWTSTIASNFAGTPTIVRDGPMTIEAGSFVTGPGAVHPWSDFYFDFQTPYTYTGGDLAFVFTHPGSNEISTALYPEVVNSDVGTHGIARTTSAFQSATVGSQTTFYVMRLHYGYGAGCAQSNGSVPVLVQNGDTTGGAGGTILFTTSNAAPSAPVVTVLSFLQISAPLGACTLLVSPDVPLFAGVTNGYGRVAMPITVPPSITLSFFAQSAVLDAGSPLGFVLTNGVSPSAQ